MAPAPPPAAAREETVALANRQGLHLRPATRFAETAARYRSDIRVTLDGRSVNGKSTLSLATLAAECGARLAIRAEGEDAAAAVEALVALVRSKFGEAGSG
jgi:phosphotransferase system HPr (HPr) family protein